MIANRSLLDGIKLLYWRNDKKEECDYILKKGQLRSMFTAQQQKILSFMEENGSGAVSALRRRCSKKWTSPFRDINPALSSPLILRLNS